jgi:hypothetical protein
MFLMQPGTQTSLSSPRELLEAVVTAAEPLKHEPVMYRVREPPVCPHRTPQSRHPHSRRRAAAQVSGRCAGQPPERTRRIRGSGISRRSSDTAPRAVYFYLA